MDLAAHTRALGDHQRVAGPECPHAQLRDRSDSTHQHRAASDERPATHIKRWIDGERPQRRLSPRPALRGADTESIVTGPKVCVVGASAISVVHPVRVGALEQVAEAQL